MDGRRWLTRLGVTAGALALLGAAAACGDDDGGDDDDSGGFDDKDGVAGVPSAGGVATAQAGTGSPAAIGVLDRKIIFTAGIALSVGDVQAAFSDVSRLATSAGGFVERSSFGEAGDEGVEATLTIRVPAERYQETLAELRGLPGAAVKTESSKSSEVTEEYTDLQSRLRNLERTEQQYLALLEQATTIPDILTVQDRLSDVRLQVETIQGRLQALDDLTDLATIDVRLTAAPPAKVAGDDGPKSVRAAFVDAWAWFREASRYVMAGVAVLAVAAIFLALPAGVVVGVALIVKRVRPGTA